MADEKETVDIFDMASEEFNFGEVPTLVTKDPMSYFQDLLVKEADYPKTPNDAFKSILKNLQRNAKL